LIWLWGLDFNLLLFVLYGVKSCAYDLPYGWYCVLNFFKSWPIDLAEIGSIW